MGETKDLEKVVVFLTSSAACALTLIIINGIFGKIVVLGNLYFNPYTSAVLVSLALNLLLLLINRADIKLFIKDANRYKILFSLLSISIIYSIYTFLIQPKFELVNILGGFIVAVDIVIVQYFVLKYSLKILSKDF